MRIGVLLVAASMVATASCGGSDPGSRAPVGETIALEAAHGAPAVPVSRQAAEPKRAEDPDRFGKVDISALSPREADAYYDAIATLLAPCPEVPVSIGQCMVEHRACAACVPAARFLAKQIASGKAQTDREAAFHARFDPGRTKEIVLGSSPSKGPSDAAETIVVWADFECPMCARFEPMLDDVARRFPNDVRLVFKHYPISHHAHAEAAARAAIAAGNQGKFWEMGRMLFENQTALEQADIERYAKDLGLDVRRLRADMQAPLTTEILQQDRKQADDLGLQGTPFVFFDGRELDLSAVGANAVDDMADWVNIDLELAARSRR